MNTIEGEFLKQGKEVPLITATLYAVPRVGEYVNIDDTEYRVVTVVHTISVLKHEVTILVK